MKRPAAIAAALAFLFVWQARAQESLPQLVKKIQPAVVTILYLSGKGKFKAIGTGFFINPQGHIITNRHVLAATDWPDNPYAAFLVSVKTHDGKSYNLKEILADDKKADLVKLAVDMPHASEYLQISKSLPEVGERVAVVGSPFGLEQTLSDGVVSAVRTVPGLGEILQISAPISPGSSGSPVVNMKGEVIGVATLQIVEGQNLNFAIPGNRALALLQKATKPQIRKKPDLSKYSDEELMEIAGIKAPRPPATREKPRTQGKDPGGPAEVFFEQGQKFLKDGKYEKAAEAFKQAIRLNPDYVLAYNNLAAAYGMSDRWKEALEVYKQIVRLRPDDAGNYHSLGTAYDQLGRHREALEAYKQMVRLKPDEAGSHNSLGLAYGRLGLWQEAVAAYKQAIRIDPDLAVAHSNLGQAYYHLGRYQEGKDSLKQAIRLKPDLPWAHYCLGWAYLIEGNQSAALEEYKILQRLNPELANDLFDDIYK